MATLSALQHFGFFWTPGTKATCLQELPGHFMPRLLPNAQNRVYAKKRSCIQMLDTTLNIGRVSLELAPMIESLKNLHCCLGFRVRTFFSSVDLIARRHNKLVLGLLKTYTVVWAWELEHFLLILIVRAEDFLLIKYRETPTKIRSAGMFSIQIGDWLIQISPYVHHNVY